MCDYDWSYEEISARDVVTRKPHECGSCMGIFPKGTKMRVAVGLTDGDLGRTYCCQACHFCLNQVDETPLHLCWGWNWGGGGEFYGEPIWDYVNDCLEKGETPTVAGLEAHTPQHADD